MNGDRETNPDEYLQAIAISLDAVELVPDEVLRELVTRDGACMALYRLDQQPEWFGDELTDRHTAAQICAGCPVQLECLELELRTSGDTTLGVWGALPAEDVRALHPLWCSHRGRSGNNGPDGGECA
jgi:WhiB family redox-sensing transcriptional regulator